MKLQARPRTNEKDAGAKRHKITKTPSHAFYLKTVRRPNPKRLRFDCVLFVGTNVGSEFVMRLFGSIHILGQTRAVLGLPCVQGRYYCIEQKKGRDSSLSRSVFYSSVRSDLRLSSSLNYAPLDAPFDADNEPVPQPNVDSGHQHRSVMGPTLHLEHAARC